MPLLFAYIKTDFLMTWLIYSSLLTHICLVDPSILINWTSPFPIVGCLVYVFICILFQIDIPVSILRRMIWVCTVCLCPKKWMLRLYGLTDNMRLFFNFLVLVFTEESGEILSGNSYFKSVQIQMGPKKDFYNRYMLKKACLSLAETVSIGPLLCSVNGVLA